MTDRLLENAIPPGPPTHRDVQQLIEAERGEGRQGIRRAWQASDSDRIVLTSTAAGVKISRDNGATAPTNVINDGTAAGGSLAGTYPNPTVSVATIDAIVPPGTIWAYGGGTVPTGWLACAGASVLRATYPKLFAAISTTYGAVDASHFTLPDLRDRMIMGASATHPLGIPGGSATGGAHTHPGSHLHGMAHVHGMQGHTHTEGAHDHGMAAHTHLVDLDHDHPNAVGAAAASPTGTNSVQSGSGATVPATNHLHPVDIPSLTATLRTSGGPSTPNTSLMTAASTGAPSPTATDQGPTLITDYDSTVYNADYGAATAANLPPFLPCTYMIRTG